MDAHEYFIIEQVVLDRLDDVERSSLEHAFHFEAVDETDEEAAVPGCGRGARRRPPHV